jgi:hypothetical protein
MGSARRAIARRAVGEEARPARPVAAALVAAAPLRRDRASALAAGGRGAAAAAAPLMEAESDSIEAA